MTQSHSLRRVGRLLPFLAGTLVVDAEVRLPSIFDSHMVLQRDRAVPVWGRASPGEEVTVGFAGETASTRADADGRWEVSLGPLEASSEGRTLTVRGDNTLELDDVLVGEVWLCSGQSNMEWTVRKSADAKREIAAADHPRIRHIKIERRPAKRPEDDAPSDGWKVCQPGTVANFSAVGYYFARRLVDDLDVPVGLIGSNWGGTRIEPWTPPAGFEHVEALEAIRDKLDEYPALRDKPSDRKSEEPAVNHQSPLALYNGMIHPLVPYALRGALWYQGESNNGEGMLYHEKMKALIHGWRTVWEDPEMPFYYVQLAPFRYRGEGREFDLPGIWQAQLKTLEVPHTGMAVTTDIGDLADIHPRNKQEVGRRLALWALAKTYGRDGLAYSGPLYRRHRVAGDAIRVEFDEAGSGLGTRDGEPPTHFEIAGSDGVFQPAEAKIDGAGVVVRGSGVKSPKQVRFGWHQEAEPNLINAAGLPASPFTTADR